MNTTAILDFLIDIFLLAYTLLSNNPLYPKQPPQKPYQNLLLW